MSTQVTNQINDVKDDVRGLRNDFMTMEKGRLTAAEVKINHLSTKLELLQQQTNVEVTRWNKLFDAAWKIITIVLATYIAVKLGLHGNIGG